MRETRSIVSLCQFSLAIISCAAGLVMAGCGSESGAPAPAPGQAQAVSDATVPGKGKAKSKLQVSSRRELHEQGAPATKTP
jgi:hypothetical protein